MDHVRRLIRDCAWVAIFALVLLHFGEARGETVPAVPGSSYAASSSTVSTVTRYRADKRSFVTTGPAQGYGDSQASACHDYFNSGGMVAYCSSQGFSGGGTFSGAGGIADGFCYVICSGNPTPGVGLQAANAAGPDGTMCPTGSTSVEGVCTTYSCPSGGTLSGTTCVLSTACPTGFTLDSGGTTCSAADCPGDQRRNSSGTCACNGTSPSLPVSTTYQQQLQTAPTSWPSNRTYCLSSCTVVASPFSFNPTSKVLYWSVEAQLPQSTCSGTNINLVDNVSAPNTAPAPGPETDYEKTPVDDPAAACAKSGGSWGTVSGTGTCLPKSVAPVQTSPGSTTGSATTTNPDGSTSTTTRTETPVTNCNTAGVCTTTTTITETTVTRNSGGTITGTTTTSSSSTQPGTGSGSGSGDGEEDESSFGSTCSAGAASISCAGDAIQCAIARKQYEDSCRLTSNKGGLSEADAVTEFDTSRGFDKATLTAAPVALSSITGETFLAGGSLTDASFTLKGEAVVLPFASLNPILNAIGIAFLAICGIMCYRIVARGVE